jgi:hypothetical protein
MIAPADLERAVQGFWSVHPSRTTYFGKEHFRRRPEYHIAFHGPEWRLYETGWRWRLKHAIGTSQGRWQIIDLDGRALLVLTVLSYRPSTASQAGLESNYGYTGGAMVVMAAGAARSEEALKMRSGEARMYFLPVHLQPQELIMALPSNGRRAPRQRWARARIPAAA